MKAICKRFVDFAISEKRESWTAQAGGGGGKSPQVRAVDRLWQSYRYGREIRVGGCRHAG